MSNVWNAVKQYFREEEWNFETNEDKNLLRTRVNGKNGTMRVIVKVNPDRETFQCMSFLPNLAPEDKRIAVGETCMRANFGLIIGNFELDYSDGEISYKTSTKYADDMIPRSVIHHLVIVNVVMADKYLPAFLAVMFGSSTPGGAIEDVEKED